MKEETAVMVLNWLSTHLGGVIALLIALIPVLALLLITLLVYGIYWKGGGR